MATTLGKDVFSISQSTFPGACLVGFEVAVATRSLKQAQTLRERGALRIVNTPTVPC
jgi:hypothetical protein